MSIRKRQPSLRAKIQPPRTEVVSLRFTSADLDLLERVATAQELLITEYIRRVSLERAKADGEAFP
jgi:hypothetical protein